MPSRSWNLPPAPVARMSRIQTPLNVLGRSVLDLLLSKIVQKAWNVSANLAQGCPWRGCSWKKLWHNVGKGCHLPFISEGLIHHDDVHPIPGLRWPIAAWPGFQTICYSCVRLCLMLRVNKQYGIASRYCQLPENTAALLCPVVTMALTLQTTAYTVTQSY